jgi:hypothetical protein
MAKRPARTLRPEQIADPLRPTAETKAREEAKSKPREDEPTGPDEDQDTKALKVMKERFTYATNEWKDIRKESLKDRTCLTPEGPWSSSDRSEREAAGRPVLTLDEISQYTNQLVNDILQNKRGIKVTPVGNGATDKTAEYRANRIRQIEYRSNAQQTYTTAFENCVNGSYGFGRIVARYLTPTSFDQELLIDPFPNPDMVTPDPDFLMADLSDCKYWFVREPWRHDEFRARFPKAKVQNFDLDTINKNKDWLTTDTVMVGEYWTIDFTNGRLYLLRDPNTQQETKFTWTEGKPVPPDELIVKRANGKPAVRDIEIPRVVKRLTNGIEFLETIEWPGKYIPLFGCLGKIIYVGPEGQAKRQIHSLIRMGRDPFMLFCYYGSTEAELIGMTPKIPAIGYVGQFRTRAEDWQTANHSPKPFLEVDPKTEATGEAILPLPQWNPYNPPVQALEVGKEGARRSIQSAMGGSPLPTSAQRRNDKSGVALKQIEASAAKGSFHFVNHLDNMIQRAGVILDDLLDHFEDTKRDVTIRTPTGDPKVVTINDRENPDSPQMGQGYEHDVTLSVGPSQDSERDAASDFADTLVGVSPEVFKLLGPMIVQLKNLGPIGESMSKLLKAALPPEIQAIYDQIEGKEPQDNVPPAVKAQLAQAQKIIKDLTQKLETQQAKQAASVQIAQGKDAVTMQKAELDNATKVEIANIQAASAQIIKELDGKSKELDAQLKAFDLHLLEIQHQREDMAATADRHIDAASVLVDHNAQQAGADQGQQSIDQAAQQQAPDPNTPTA